jgi:NitT/TauT family transport system permease protein
MAWKAGVAAEVLTVTPISIGKQLYNSKLYLETSELFAWTVIVVILSLIIEKLVVRLIGRLDKRRDHAKD